MLVASNGGMVSCPTDRCARGMMTPELVTRTFTRKISVAEAFATWEGRQLLDRVFGVGFGTTPTEPFWKTERYIPPATLRARQAAAIDDRQAMRVVRQWRIENGHTEPESLSKLTVEGRRVTPRQFVDEIQARADQATRAKWAAHFGDARWQADHPRCCA